MKTIAIIDDDVYIGNMLEEVLQNEGYGVLRAYSGTEALLLLSNNKPDLVLLDLMLPGLSGEEVLPHIQGIPVIVVSAKLDVQDKVNLLRGGAVDYITKPFDNEELLARIDIHLRLRDGGENGSVIKVGDLTLDTTSHEACVMDTVVHLTRTEYAILKILMQKPKQIFAKNVILEGIFEDTPDCTEHSLKQHISNLRKKLRDAGNKEYIEAIWGIGFKMIDLD